MKLSQTFLLQVELAAILHDIGDSYCPYVPAILLQNELFWHFMPSHALVNLVHIFCIG